MPLPEISNQSGFTLMELLVSLVILGIILVPVVGVFSHILRVSRDARRRSRAVYLARQHLVLTVATDSYGSLTPGIQSGTFAPPNDQFEWVQKTSILPSSRPAHSAKIIRVRILFPSSVTGQTRTIRCNRTSNCEQWDCARVLARR